MGTTTPTPAPTSFWSEAAAIAEKVATFVEAAAPAAALAGPEGAAIGSAVSTGAAFVSSLLQGTQAAAETIATGDLATIEAAAAKVQAANALLAEQIAAS